MISAATLSSCGCCSVRQNNTIAEEKTIKCKLMKSDDGSETKELYNVKMPTTIQNELNLEEGKNRLVLQGSPASDWMHNGKQVLSQKDFIKSSTVYVVQQDFDLSGATITIPDDCVISFEDGSINNGTIIGNNTAIVYSGAVFSGVTIQGSWNVPEIRGSMFADVNTCCNRLKDVIALTGDDVENVVYIEDGNYTLKVSEVAEHLLPLKSHTTVILDGQISVIGNSFPRYRIFSVFNVDNITIKGCGSIIGDRDAHTFIPEAPEPESKRGFNTSHEYGHGIEINNSRNIDISGITITKCIGDGICIVGSNISCRHLNVSYCRRQGISVVGGERIAITNCDISHIWDSRKAGFGIDIEPHIGNSASYITISDCNISVCNGGMNFQCHTFESVKHIRVDNCKLRTFGQDINGGSDHEQYRAIMCFGANDVKLVNCNIEDNNTLVYVEDAENFSISDSKMISRGSRYGIVLRKLRGVVTIHNNDIYVIDKKSSKAGRGIAIANLHNTVLTDNEIVSGNLSSSTDTDCDNVVMKHNIIKATWEPGQSVTDCVIENNSFTKKVILKGVEESSIVGNKMQSLKIRDDVTRKQIIKDNRIKKE